MEKLSRYQLYCRKFPEKAREMRRLRVIKWRALNPGKVKENNKQSNLQRKTSLKWRLGYTLRNRLRLAIKNDQKIGSAVDDLGCSVPALKTYLEKLFKPGMTWDNWSKKGWHIDHIIPISSFDLSDREQFLKANHYTNLQPMWAHENFAKGSTYVRAA